MGSVELPHQLLNNEITVIHYHNGDRYEGQLLNDARHGQGKYIGADRSKRHNYEYEGNWVGDVREGFGKCWYYSEELYVGHWQNS